MTSSVHNIVTLRLDHAYGIAMDNEWSGTENLHGGARTDQGEHAYQWHQGRMYNGLVGAMYALTDVSPGSGGFVIVPGSHRANHPYTPPLSSPLVRNTPIFEPFIYENDHFTKTGSGQT